MTAITGLSGLRPATTDAARQGSVPPYDVIKPGSALEGLLKGNPRSLWHVTLGAQPLEALKSLAGSLVEDAEPCFYVYEQRWGQGQTRLGVFAAVEVTPYAQGQVIRHEKVFDDKVQGRLALTRQTGLTLEPVFLLTRSGITAVLRQVAASEAPLYDFTSDFAGESELHGIANRFWRVPSRSRRPFFACCDIANSMSPSCRCPRIRCRCPGPSVRSWHCRCFPRASFATPASM